MAWTQTFFSGFFCIALRSMLMSLGASHWPTSDCPALPAASMKRMAAVTLFRSRIHVYSVTTILSIGPGPSISLRSLPLAGDFWSWNLHATSYMPWWATMLPGSTFSPLAKSLRE